LMEQVVLLMSGSVEQWVQHLFRPAEDQDQLQSGAVSLSCGRKVLSPFCCVEPLPARVFPVSAAYLANDLGEVVVSQFLVVQQNKQFESTFPRLKCRRSVEHVKNTAHLGVHYSATGPRRTLSIRC
jgi:hypothetical protein